MKSAYKADRINENLWIVKRFQHHGQVPENFTNADYDECQVNVSTMDPAVAIEAAIAQQSWA